jgi:leucyl-tRNA synthetase
LRSVPDEARCNEHVVDGLRSLVVMLAPAAPHISCELWEAMRELPAAAHWDPLATVLEQDWPTFDPDALVQDTTNVSLQIGKKFRGAVAVPTELVTQGGTDELVAFVAASELGQKWIPEGDKIAKTIVPKSRNMVGFVLRK